MKLAIAMLCLVFAASSAWAQDKKEATPAQKKQQARMKDCNEKAGD